MPARAKRAATRAPEPEVEEVEESEINPLLRHLEKDYSPTMSDFVEWFEENVADFADLDPDRILVVGVYAYPYFQRSEFNQERKAERKAARGAAEPEEEAEEEKPARATRTAKAPARKAASNGRTAAAKPSAAPKRTRARAAAAEVPY